MSEIRATTISDAAGTGPIVLTGQSAAKASFRYDQTTNTVLASKNVSSIVDDTTGEFTVNYTSAFLSVDTQRPSGMLHSGTGRVISVRFTGPTNSVIPFRTTNNAASTDTDGLSTVAVIGDLA